jgi:hypothetical protein
MTTAEFLARAHEVTDAATPGPWVARPSTDGLPSDGPTLIRIYADVMDGEPNMVADLEYDAIGGPDAEFIAASRTLLPQAVAAIEAVQALHERVTRWGNDDYSISQDAYDTGDYEDWTSLEAFDVCAECFRIEQTPDQHDGADCEHTILEGLWPCSTVRAITAALDGAP